MLRIVPAKDDGPGCGGLEEAIAEKIEREQAKSRSEGGGYHE
ncbi:hypothetical protein ACFLXE_07380 [Chloroflexota bacterium]